MTKKPITSFLQSRGVDSSSGASRRVGSSSGASTGKERSMPTKEQVAVFLAQRHYEIESGVTQIYCNASAQMRQRSG